MPNPYGVDDNVSDMRDISLQERVGGPPITRSHHMAFDKALPGPVRIDLACGQNVRAGFEGADLFAPNPTHRIDILKFPWRPLRPDGSLGDPLADNSVDELHSAHFVEHIPMAFIDKDNVAHLVPDIGRKDMFFAFFDEAYRVLKPDIKPDPATGRPAQPGGKMTVIVPYLMNHRAFQDPTHRRFLCETSFLYLAKQWRDGNGLSHYGVDCNFNMHIDRTTSMVEGAYNAETAQMRATHYWNVVMDIVVTLDKFVP